MRLSAIVVAYGKEQLLATCVARLEEALARVDGPTELIVVANELAADTVHELQRRALVVEGGRELGFAGGVAAGLAAARGAWVVLVNDDCLVDPNALAAMLDAGESDGRVGSVAALVCFADRPGVVNSAGLEVDTLGVARERLLGQPIRMLARRPTEVFGASAALALYRGEMLDELHGFDTTFFAYLEDADLAWRAQMAGWRCLLAPRAVAVHHHSATLTHGSKAKHLLVGRNRVRMLAKNATASTLRRRLPGILIYDLLYVAYVAATSRTAAPLRGRLRGLAEWRAYRAAGRAGRRPVELARAGGLRAALARNRVYRENGRR